ncbi:MAG: hypothetical protein ACI89T_001859 [Cognaticolwellia sp.]|jgi:uncharacterized protein YceK
MKAILLLTVFISGCTSIAQSLTAGQEKEYQAKVQNVEKTCQIDLNYEAHAHRVLESKLLPIIDIGVSEQCLVSVLSFKNYKINKTKSKYGVSKQYVITTGYKYINQNAGSIPSDFMYVYTENGEVTSIQN